jgi:hypothetical protein
MRTWLQQHLSELLVEAREANEHRTAIAASDALVKVSGLSTLKIEANVTGGPLDGLSAPQLITLLECIRSIEMDSGPDARAIDVDDEETTGGEGCVGPLS